MPQNPSLRERRVSMPRVSRASAFPPSASYATLLRICGEIKHGGSTWKLSSNADETRCLENSNDGSSVRELERRRRGRRRQAHQDAGEPGAAALAENGERTPAEPTT